MKRMITVTMLLLVLSLGVTGCVHKKPKQGNRGQNSNVGALEYMEQKYGEKFEYVQPWGNSMSGDHELIVACESLAGREIVVKISNYKEENRVFQDNYLAVKYCEETVDFLGQCANEIFGESRVYYNVAHKALSAGLSADASFEEYFADEEGFTVALITVKESSFTSREQAEKVMDPILSAYGGWYLCINLIVVEDAEYESLDRDTLSDRIIRREFKNCARLTKQNDDVVLKWLERK